MKIVKFDHNGVDREHITNQCIKIANTTTFPTTYEDVYNHLFASDQLLNLFLIDDKDNIKGFSVFDYIAGEYNMLYLSGMILNAEIQGKGYAKQLMKTALEMRDCYQDVLPQQLTSHTLVNQMFQRLGPNSAYGCVCSVSSTSDKVKKILF